MAFAAEAYEPVEENEWPRGWARAVLVTLIAMGFLGWAFAPNASVWLKAGMCVVTIVIEGWGFIAAVQWSRALKRERVVGPLLYWATAMVGCAAWTMFSIYHALGLIVGEPGEAQMGALASPAYVAFTYLALSLPFHEWAIERVETAPKKRARPAANEPGPQAHGSQARGLIPWLMALLLGPGSLSPAMAHEPFRTEPNEPLGPRAVSQKMPKAQVRNLTEPDRVRARLLIRQGRPPAQVHADTKVPISTLKRWKTEMEKAA